MSHHDLWNVSPAGAGGDPNRSVTTAGMPGEVAGSLRSDVERLMIIAEALWEILRDRFGLDDAELFRRMAEIDLRDGRADGRLAPSPPRPCPDCGRVMSRGRPICLFCGRASLAPSFER